MSITNELREYAGSFYLFRYKDVREKLDVIADRIDAEHERQLEVLYRDMSDAEWMRLPKDAEGVPIHLGDMMHGTCPSGKYVCGEVSAIGDNKFWLINVQFSLHPGYMRHYREPTVEDVLLELLDEAEHFNSLEEEREAISEYAAKLQLRGGAE